MPSITSVGDLPDWFELSAYDVCDKFTSHEWGTQLHVRKDESAAVRLSNSDNTKLKLPSVDGVDGIDALLARIARSCIRQPSDYRRKLVESISTLYSPKGGGMQFDGCVRPALFGDIARRDERDPANYMVWDMLAFDEVRSTGRPILEVDLSAPDSALYEKFKEVIKQYRVILNKKNPGKVASDESIQKLRQYKVLAYLDLTHWAALSGTQIHAEVMARALFPSSPRGGRFIRETVATWANDAMQSGFISTLLAPT